MGKIIKKQQGFTLIEILVVIGIIAILAAVVLIAINPARQFKQARDSQRTSNVNAILNSIGQYIADHKGDLPAGIPSGTHGTDDVDIPQNLCEDLLPEYIAALPTDPQSSFKGDALVESHATDPDCADLATGESGYKVIQDSVTKRITVSAVGEITTPIEVTR